MNPHHPVGLSTLGQVSLTVSDLPRAVAFYQQKLGMTHLFTVGAMAFFDCDGTRLMLAAAQDKPTEPSQHPASILYFTVPSTRAMYEILGSRDVTFESEPHLVARMQHHDLWMAFFRDSESNLLALMSEEVRSTDPASSGLP